MSAPGLVPVRIGAPPKAQIGYAFVATNLLVTTLAVVAAATLPPGKQLSASAPEAKKQIQVDQPQTNLVRGINPNPGARQQDASAPAIKAPIQNLSVPNTSVTTLSTPAAPLQIKPVDLSSYQKKYDVTVFQAPNILALGINPNPRATQESDSSSSLGQENQVVAQQFLNYSTLGIPGPATLQIKPVDTSQLQTKYQVTDYQQRNILALGINPNPASRALSDSTSALRRSPVVADQFTNYLALGVNPNPVVRQQSDSAPWIKYQVQLDQPLQTPLTLGINPNPRALAVDASAPPPKAPIVALTTPNLLISTLYVPPAPLPPLPAFDSSQWQGKLQVQVDVTPNMVLLGIPDAPPPVNPPTVGNTPGGGGGGGRLRHHRYGEHPDKTFDDLLKKVVAEVLYKEIVEDGTLAEKKQAGKVVAPLADDSRIAIPRVEAVDWRAVEDNAQKVAALFRIWSRMQQDQADDEWFMLGD